MAKAGRGSDQFPLRLPDGLRDRIKQRADRSGRSMNAEIVAALEDAFPEGMGIGEFVEMYVAPIAKAQSEEDKDRLVEAANRAAEKANAPFRARAIEASDGRYTGEAYMLESDGRTFVRIAEYFEKIK